MRRLRPHAPTHQYASTEIPDFTLTVAMVPSYRCQPLAGASPSSSSFYPALHSVSVISSPSLRSPLLAFLPSVHSILVPNPDPPLFLPLFISHHRSLSWKLHLEPPTPLPVNLHQEFHNSSLLPITTTPSYCSAISVWTLLRTHPDPNPSHSATCSSSLIPAHCSHLSFPIPPSASLPLCLSPAETPYT